VHDLSIEIADVRALINWRAFFGAWKLDASFAALADVQGCDHCRAQWLAAIPQEHRMKASEAMQLFKDANRVIDYLQKSVGYLQARVAILPAGSRDEEIFYQNGKEEFVLPTPRQLHVAGDGCRLALADYVKPLSQSGEKEDWIGLFAVTIGMGVQQIIEKRKELNDDYETILYQTVADRLAEAATEQMNEIVRAQLWGYDAKGIRPAIGYPSLPDQKTMFLMDELIGLSSINIRLTENGAMYPQASVCGLYIANRKAEYFMI
jgi:5-methyltetrahydrofolate--homocysteine methyltransferase